MIVVETDRLVLRRLTLNDAPFVVEILNEPAFVRFVGDRGVKTLNDARQYLLKGPIASYERFGFGLYLTFLKETGDQAGMCGLLKRDALSDADVGFALLPAYRRKGYAFEAASAVIAHGRTAFGLRRILAITSPDNVASIKVLEKLGLRFEAVIQLPGDTREVKLFAVNYQASR